MDDHEDTPAAEWNRVAAHVTAPVESQPKNAVVLARRRPCPDEAGAAREVGDGVRPRDRGQSRGWLELAGARAGSQETGNGRFRAGGFLAKRRAWIRMRRLPGGCVARCAASGSAGILAAQRFRAMVGAGRRHARDSLVSFMPLLRAYAEDEPGYRRACATIMEHFGTTRDPFIAMLAARVCTLGRDPGVSTDRIVALAEQAARTNPHDSWSMYTLAAACAGQGESIKPLPGSTRRSASSGTGLASRWWPRSAS